MSLTGCKLWASAVAIALSGAVAAAVDLGFPFGEADLIDEINCATDTSHDFLEFPKGASKVQKILGSDSRVMVPGAEASYMRYRIGKGKGLKAGDPLVLVIEYPEDVDRSFALRNLGNWTTVGLATGRTLGDTLKPRYVGSNPESLNYPLSGKYETARQFMNLHPTYPRDEKGWLRGNSDMSAKPADGFTVALAQYAAASDPFNNGIAVKRIALYRLKDFEKVKAKINYPPADLPHRYVFWREEMDNRGAGFGDEDARTEYYRYKVNFMRVMGVNGFARTLLEFGHNQGWDSYKHGGSDWYRQASDPDHWLRICAMFAEYAPDLYLLPYYEYAGSIGEDEDYALGSRCLCLNINGEVKYTHISWTGAPKGNADLADPIFIKDAQNLLDCTQPEIIKLVASESKKKKKNVTMNGKQFIGAWFRPRPEANPISYNDDDIKRFKKETGRQDVKVTRKILNKDKALHDAYKAWFLLKRREWMLAQRDYLRQNVNPDAAIIFTVDPSEEGWGHGKGVTTESVPVWREAMKNDKALVARCKVDPNWKDYKDFGVVELEKYRTSQAERLSTWGRGRGAVRWDLASPPANPDDLKNDSGAMMAYGFHRMYSVLDDVGIERFRCKDGLAMIRHYCLNENDLNYKKDGKLEEMLGYWVAQFDRAGKYCMLTEANALIQGDPRYLGYLAPTNMTRLFPEYVRAFNLAFLALPAVPSTWLKDINAGGKIGVREYKTGKHGTYYAVVNTSFNDIPEVTITLPAKGKVTNCVTGETIPSTDGKITLKNMYSGQVYALNVK